MIYYPNAPGNLSHRNLTTRMRVRSQDELKRVSAFNSYTLPHTLSDGVLAHTHTGCASENGKMF